MGMHQIISSLENMHYNIRNCAAIEVQKPDQQPFLVFLLLIDMGRFCLIHYIQNSSTNILHKHYYDTCKLQQIIKHTTACNLLNKIQGNTYL